MRPRSRARRGERGVTLVELMVAVIVMTIVMFTLSSLFQAVIKVWVLGAANAELTQRARLALVRISEDVQTAMPPVEEAQSAFIGIGNASAAMTDSVSDELHFFGMTYNSNEGRNVTDANGERDGDIVRFGYWLKKPAGEDSRLQLRKITGDLPDSSGADVMPDGGAKLLTVGLGGGGASFAYYVGDFQVQYYSSATGLWYEEWDSRTSGGLTGATYDDGKLPSLVRVTVQMQDPTGRIDPQRYAIIIKPGASNTVNSFLDSDFQ